MAQSQRHNVTILQAEAEKQLRQSKLMAINPGKYTNRTMRKWKPIHNKKRNSTSQHVGANSVKHRNPITYHQPPVTKKNRKPTAAPRQNEYPLTPYLTNKPT